MVAKYWRHSFRSLTEVFLLGWLLLLSEDQNSEDLGNDFLSTTIQNFQSNTGTDHYTLFNPML